VEPATPSLADLPQELAANQKLSVDGVHIGEFLGRGTHLPLVGAWLHGDPTTLGLLTVAELAVLVAVLNIQCVTDNSATWTARWREILPFLRDYKDVDTARFRGADGMPKTFVGTQPKHRIAAANYWRLKRAVKGKRSEALANYAQSVMLLATAAYGSSIEEKCRTVAALVIEDCPERGTKGYNAEKDVAALIARIIHGDPYHSRPGHFLIPFWAADYQPVRRPPHRPRGDRDAQIEALRQLLLKYGDGNRIAYLITRRGREKLTVSLLAKWLKVSERTVRRYLQQLEANHEIDRDGGKGRGDGLRITLRPCFGHVTED
jgi:HTH domain